MSIGATSGGVMGVIKFKSIHTALMWLSWDQALDVIEVAVITGVVGGVVGWLIKLGLDWCKKRFTR